MNNSVFCIALLTEQSSCPVCGECQSVWAGEKDLCNKEEKERVGVVFCYANVKADMKEASVPQRVNHPCDNAFLSYTTLYCFHVHC